MEDFLNILSKAFGFGCLIVKDWYVLTYPTRLIRNTLNGVGFLLVEIEKY